MSACMLYRRVVEACRSSAPGIAELEGLQLRQKSSTVVTLKLRSVSKRYDCRTCMHESTFLYHRRRCLERVLLCGILHVRFGDPSEDTAVALVLHGR